MKRISMVFLPLLVAMALLVRGPAAAPLTPAANAAPIHPAVLADLAAAPDGRVTFFVLMTEQADLSPADRIDDWQAKGRWVFEALQASARRSQEATRKLLASKALSSHVSQWQPFWIVNAIAVWGDADAAQALARQPGVSQILPEIKLEAPDLLLEATPDAVSPGTVEWNVRQINADALWAMGYTGKGIVVANVDTGVDYTHDALVRQYRGNLSGDNNGPFDHDYNWFDPFWSTIAPRALPATATGASPSTHGTHVMGTEVGDDGFGNQVGVAPGAQWIAAYGCCPNNASLLAALQWNLAPTRLDGSEPNPDMRPHALQNSWGGPGGSLIFEQAAAALKTAGVFVSASAGNNGVNGCGSMGSPGDLPSMFSVGASTSSDTISSISSRGPNPFSGKTGPALAAPGQGIRSSVPGNVYSSSTGTSMAGPHVAGAVALLWQANPALIGHVEYTAELLRKTATPIYTPGEVCGGVDSGSEQPNNTSGWGRLDVLRAVQIAGRGNTRLPIQVSDATGSPLKGVTLTLHKPEPVLGDVQLTGVTDDEGRFEFLVAAGPVTVTAELFGYRSVMTTTQVAYQAFFPLAPHSEPAGVGQGSVTASAPASGPSLDLTLDSLPVVTLRGIVQAADDANKRLAAQVAVLDSPLAAVETDCTGAFSLTVPTGQHQLLVTALGYEPQQAPISLTAKITETIALTPTWDYAVTGSRDGGVAFDWIDATGGLRYNLGDDAWTAVTLPAGRTFTFYGQAYGLLYPSSNGFVGLGSAFARFHGIVPFEGRPNNAIYIYAEDLNPGARLQYGTPYDNGIYVLEDGDRWILQYNEVEHWSQGDPETFQLILDLNTGEITMQYQQVSWPDFTTVGLEDSSGSRGVPYSYANSANLEAGLAVRYSPLFGQPGLVCGRWSVIGGR